VLCLNLHDYSVLHSYDYFLILIPFFSFTKVIYLDHVDFSHCRLPDSFPHIEVWKQNMIKDFSDLDLKSGSVYGMRPLLDF
jgi:hypothetical protein